MKRTIKNILFSILSLSLLLGCKSLHVKPSEEKYLLDNSGKEKYYLLNIVRENRENGKLGENPMIVFNGEPGADLSLVKMKREDIYRVIVTSKEESVKVYGKAGKDGVIIFDGNTKLKFFNRGIENEDDGN